MNTNLAKQTEINKRIAKATIVAFALLAAGACYVIVVRLFHVGICCPFERLTGYLCPGCGVSGMMLNLLSGNIHEAFLCNPVTFCLVPVLIALIVYLLYRYIRYGNCRMPKWMEIGVVVLIGIYLVWGVVRNLI